MFEILAKVEKAAKEMALQRRGARMRDENAFSDYGLGYFGFLSWGNARRERLLSKKTKNSFGNMKNLFEKLKKKYIYSEFEAEK